MNANPSALGPPWPVNPRALDAHPACTCGKGKVRGFLCWPCYEASDDEQATPKPTP